MNKAKIITILIMTLISSFCLAERLTDTPPPVTSPKKSLICISEKFTMLIKDQDGSIEAHSGSSDSKYVVTPKSGVKHFGEQKQGFLTKCNYDNHGMPFWCEAQKSKLGGSFTLQQDNIFLLISFSDQDKPEFYSVSQMGRCSEI